MMRSLFMTLMLTSILSAQVFLTKDEALKIYFPSPSAVERKTLFLTDAQVEKIQTQARANVDSKIVTYYVGRHENHLQGYALFDTRTIRTEPATYMVVISPDSSLRAVELLAFYEPEDYLPPTRWLAQFQQKKVLDEVWLKRGVQNIAGATLSAQALTEGVRRILATFRIAIPKEH
jgi:hypothetical protein